MNFKSTATTTIQVTGINDVATWYHGKEYIEKKLKRWKAKVEDRAGSNGRSKKGLAITFPTYLDPGAALKMKARIEKLVGEAIEHVLAMEEKSKNDDQAYIDAFEHRNLTGQDPERILATSRDGVYTQGQTEVGYFKAIHETIVGQEEWAEQAKAEIQGMHAGALIDLKAGYDVWDAFLSGGWERAGEVAQHQDTAVRELFIPFFDLLAEDGRDNF